MKHPLTDEIIRKNFTPDYDYLEDCGEICVGFNNDDLRAAYDLAIERMSQWVEENGHEYVTHHYELGCQSNFSQMITDFKKAMRPQQQENN